MARENEIVTEINASLKGVFSTKKYQKGRFNGIVELVDKKDQTIPVIKDSTGEVSINLSMDDIYPFEIYHRLTDSTVEDEQGFGDFIERRETSTMRMVCIFQRNRIFATKELIKAGIIQAIPQSFDKTFKKTNQLAEATVRMGDFDLDSKKVYEEEYSSEVLLKPQTVMMALGYQIETVIWVNCVSTCN